MTNVTLISESDDMLDITDVHYNLISTTEILQTSENGDRLASKNNVDFETGKASKNVIRVRPEIVKQTLHGIGTSFTESSAFVLAHLSVDKRSEVMKRIYRMMLKTIKTWFIFLSHQILMVLVRRNIRESRIRNLIFYR